MPVREPLFSFWCRVSAAAVQCCNAACWQVNKDGPTWSVICAMLLLAESETHNAVVTTTQYAGMMTLMVDTYALFGAQRDTLCVKEWMSGLSAHRGAVGFKVQFYGDLLQLNRIVRSHAPAVAAVRRRLAPTFRQREHRPQLQRWTASIDTLQSRWYARQGLHSPAQPCTSLYKIDSRTCQRSLRACGLPCMLLHNNSANQAAL